MRHQRRENKELKSLPEVVKCSSVFSYHFSHKITCKIVCDYMASNLPTQVEMMRLSDHTRRKVGLYMHLRECRCEFEVPSIISDVFEKYDRIEDLLLPLTKEIFERHGITSVITCSSYDSTIPEIIDGLLQVDMVYLLPYTEEVIKKAVVRCRYLMENHPDVWLLAANNYSQYFRRVYVGCEEYHVDTEVLLMCFDIVPDPILESVVREKGVRFRLMSLDCWSIGHALGIPSNIDTSKLTISSIPDDVEEYQERIREINRARLNIFIMECKLSNPSLDITLVNVKNTLGEMVEDYAPCDVIPCCTSEGKIFQFTLGEVPSLLKNKTNFYTNEALSESFVDFIKQYNTDRSRRHNFTITQAIERVTYPKTPLHQIIKPMNEPDNIQFTMLACVRPSEQYQAEALAQL